MTAPLPDRIAAAIANHAQRWHAAGWAGVGTAEADAANLSDNDLVAAIAEVVAERDDAAASLRHCFGEAVSLKAERDAERARADGLAADNALLREELGRRIERDMTADELRADLAAAQAKLAGGIGEVAAEREKQRRKWGSSHDAGHVHDELPRAARDLLDAVLGLGRGDDWGISIRNQGRRDRFVIAAALLVAETDRIAAAEQGGAQ